MSVTRPAARAEDAPIDILLVDPHRLVRQSLQRLLSDFEGVLVRGEVASCDEAIRLARKACPRVVLLNLGGAEVLEGARKLARQFPGVQVLVLADEADLVIQERLLQGGVAGCISNQAGREELHQALSAIMSGQRYISESLARRLAERRLPGGAASPFEGLSHREMQILLLVVEGKSTRAIARELCLTQKTVNGYRHRLLVKLGVETEVGLVHLAIREGLLRIPVTGGADGKPEPVP
ncbi:MAG TPA: response regulator [Gammaproteobacteria bacterium]|nr:response regulator [Gammaproteobacteria bacterium]